MYSVSEFLKVKINIVTEQVELLYFNNTENVIYNMDSFIVIY